MSANQYDLKSIIDSNNLFKKNDDKPVPNSANQSESDLSDDETIKLIVRKQKIIAMKLEYARLERDALLITKVAEDAKQQAEAYKNAYEAQALLCKQQEEQLQDAKASADAKVNSEREARLAAERLAAQQVAAAMAAQQAAALRAAQAAQRIVFVQAAFHTSALHQLIKMSGF